ncbi:hypothetical protein M2351_002784 [Azospirillum canadense]|nr:hypothetical protein [Azospirillum canadense]
MVQSGNLFNGVQTCIGSFHSPLVTVRIR